MKIYFTGLLKTTQHLIRNETHVRYYARWAHRRPKKVLTEEEFESTHNIDMSPQTNEPNVIQLDRHEVARETKNKQTKPKHIFQYKEPTLAKFTFNMKDIDKKSFKGDEEERKEKKEVKYTENELLSTSFDESGNYLYEKMKNNDSRVANLMFMVKSKKVRDKKGLILLEGKRLIRDALEVGCKLDYVLFSRKPDLEFIRDLVPDTGVKFYKMAYKDMQMWSDLTTCPGIMAIVKTPNVENSKNPEHTLPLTIICDNIREPSNLGAILRSSAAVGCRNIILTKGCVDLWDPKVLRSGTGAHFRLKIQKGIRWKEVPDHLPKDTSVFLADNKLVATKKTSNIAEICMNVPVLPYYSLKYSDFNSITLVIGGETEGLSEDAYKLAADKKGLRLNIPLDNDVDSLNTGTALGILVFEIKKQILTKN